MPVVALFCRVGLRRRVHPFLPSLCFHDVWGKGDDETAQGRAGRQAVG